MYTKLPAVKKLTLNPPPLMVRRVPPTIVPLECDRWSAEGRVGRMRGLRRQGPDRGGGERGHAWAKSAKSAWFSAPDAMAIYVESP